MPKKHLPELEAQCVALYEAGYTAITLSHMYGIPLSTIKNWVSKHGAKSGSAKQSMIDNARDQLINTLAKEEIEKQVASLMAEDLISIQMVREKMLEAMQVLKPTDTESAALALRAITAASTALKNTSDTRRTLLLRKSEEEAEKSLPELVVRTLSAQEFEEINDKLAKEEVDA